MSADNVNELNSIGGSRLAAAMLKKFHAGCKRQEDLLSERKSLVKKRPPLIHSSRYLSPL
jgi:hypothetical protein